MNIVKKFTAWVLLISIYAGSLAQLSISASGQAIRKTMEDRNNDAQSGLKFRLSEGVEGAEKREKTPPAATDPLGES